ncbi:hypothetical protein SBA2_380024 [Acidobacteriia bacterium SbA2]|nr:hypothetical protein SBA2_380024 [Acidobacteriia bacterium SbA2]
MMLQLLTDHGTPPFSDGSPHY